jgi:hypothetical protein
MPIKLIVSSALALFLLAIYVCCVWFAIDLASAVQANTDLAKANLAKANLETFHEGWKSSFTLVGSLVSALIIAELAVTKPTEFPTMRVAADQGTTISPLAKWLIGAYLIVWFIAGACSFVAGTLLYPNIVPALSAMGTSWFGIAVTATYAYFGIKP